MAASASGAPPGKGTIMDMLLDLWLPIVVSTVVVFVASTIAWMMLPHHKADMRAIEDEGPLDRALEEMKLEAGGYYLPNCSDKEKFKTEAFKKRWNDGPWAYVVIPPGAPSFGKNMAITLLEFFVISVFIAYLASHALAPGAEYLQVFQIVGTAGVLAYVLGTIHHQYFQMRTTRHVLACAFDGLVYALLTAGVFAAFWPEGADLATDAANIVNDAADALPTP